MHKIFEARSKLFLQQQAASFNGYTIPIATDYKTTPHYTAVASISSPAFEQFVTFIDDMKSLDNSLLCMDPELLHMRLANVEIDDGYETLAANVQEYLNTKPRMHIQGLILGGAIAAGAWPENPQDLFTFRKKVVESQGRIFEEREQNDRGWITLVRFTAPPKPAAIDYAKSMLMKDFGTITLSKATIYLPKFRTLKDSQTITTLTSA